MKKKTWFTLLEILISVMGFFVIMTVIFNLYFWIINFRYSFQARSNLLESSYYMFEKINLLLKDYTIDYEEYFNRSRVWCNSTGSFSWDVWLSWYCSNFSAFGNNNNFLWSTWTHQLYYCSSFTWYRVWLEYVIKNTSLITWCFLSWYQSFGQYALQFHDVKLNVDWNSVIWDSDDLDLWMWPQSVLFTTWVQEIYLISKDKQYRIFLRRKLVGQFDWDNNSSISWDNERLYTLQILRLRGFDAWFNHDFSWTWMYDWIIDTWACDYSKWFVCGWNSLGSIYSWYSLPLNADDWRVNLFDKSLTIADRNISIYPTKDPDLARKENQYQITPYFVVSMKTKLYSEIWQRKLRDSISDYQFTLQTTFTTKYNN